MKENKEDTIMIKLSEKELMQKRVIYVGDRIVFGVIISFGVLLGYILLVFKNKDIIIINPWFFVLLGIMGFFFFIWYVLTNDEFYYSERIFVNSNFFYVELIWICWMSIISSIFAFFYGWQHILEITILYILLYLVGYVAGRFLWLNWKEFPKKTRSFLLISIILAVIIATIIVGTILLISGNVRICIFIYIFGIGSLCSTGLNYLMLHLYYDKSGNDVVEDPPSMLVIIGIVNTLIVSFIVWLIMIILIPLIPGSKRGGRKSGKSSFQKKSSAHGSRVPRIYRSRRYYFFGPAIKEERPSVDYYWRVAMGIVGTHVKYKGIEVDDAKKKIIDLLFEEEIVPTQKDFNRLLKINSPLLDFALDELINEKKIRYFRSTSSHWWTKGYSLTENYYKEIINERGEIDRAKLERVFNENIDKLLRLIKEKEPIKTKYQLWDLAIEIGLSPKWKIMSALNKLIKEKKIIYSRKIPKGYYIP
jgi:hypothetical protein